jgi:DNA polymerase-1
MTDTSSSNDIYLVDGSAFIFRAYHALPPMTNPEGVVVNAVYGFCNMMVKLLNDMEAPCIAVIFDAARKNFRNDIYPEYKANRDDAPDDLIPQFAIIREATKAFGMEAIELEGFEADDLIATYARIGREQGRKVTIVSSDKDLMQLVNDDVVMFDPMKNKMLGIDDVIEKFGVRPDKVVDIQALAGDATDNVPGVPGIGVKTAAQLINEYGDLETLLTRAGEIKQPKRRETLIDNAENARISMKLVTLDDQVDVPFNLDDLAVHDTNLNHLSEFLELQGFKSVLTRLGQKPNSPKQSTDIKETDAMSVNSNFPSISDNTYTLIKDIKTLNTWINDAKRVGILSFDTETTGLTPAKAELVGISISSTVGKAAYIPLTHKSGEADLLDPDGGKVPNQIDLDECLGVLKDILEDESVLKIAQNAKYDWQMFKKHGIDVSPIDDTMMISYAVEAGLHGHGMDELSQLYLDHKPIPYKEVAGTGKSQVTFDYVPLDKALDYAAEDADITLRLWHILKPKLEAARLTTIYETLDRPLIPVIGRMELTGIDVDRNILRDMSNQFATDLARLESEIQEEAGTQFNVSSPKQLGTILFDQMGMKGGKKTKTGDWSTNASILEDLALESDFVRKVLDYRHLSKLKSTYTDALQDQINTHTGRVHTSFSLAGTSTGRLASSDPNLQNIPIRTEEGRKIRTAFIATGGKKIVSVDYSQVELRLVAEMADIPRLKKAFKDGHDIHAITASEVFGVSLENMDSETRRKAKAINFGIVYGISGFGLSKQLGIEVSEASRYIALYFQRFPELQQFMEETKAFAHDHGYVETLYGRKCWVRGINDKNHAIKSGAERAAINAPVQGTAADIMKRAMIQIDTAIQVGDIDAVMMLQVHDELIFEVDEDKADTVLSQIRDIMENVIDLETPLLAEGGIANSWAEAH